jgi:hypothetical protein
MAEGAKLTDSVYRSPYYSKPRARNHKRTPKTCDVCETTYNGTARQRYCGKTCAARAGHIKWKYGLTPQDYNQRNTGHCHCCHEPLTSQHNTHIDHNHTTGHVRGILCVHCNTTLGYAKESQERLHRAQIYLLQHTNPLHDLLAHREAA